MSAVFLTVSNGFTRLEFLQRSKPPLRAASKLPRLTALPKGLVRLGRPREERKYKYLLRRVFQTLSGAVLAACRLLTAPLMKGGAPYLLGQREAFGSLNIQYTGTRTRCQAFSSIFSNIFCYFRQNPWYD